MIILKMEHFIIWLLIMRVVYLMEEERLDLLKAMMKNLKCLFGELPILRIVGDFGKFLLMK